MTVSQDRLALLALHFIPGIGHHTIRQLISYCGNAEQVFKTPRGKLMKIPGVGPSMATSLNTNKSFERAEIEFKKAETEDIRLLFFTDHDYPSRLRQIFDSPTLLYVRGEFDFENEKSIAIVGTRNATNYGRRCVEELIQSLIPHHPLIVSGLAYGIDIAAHKAAEKHGLPTIAVLGSGVDVIYPSNHSDTAKSIQTNGGLVSEQFLGTKPDAYNFPARNRIIAGLCDALIVVEAAEKGGALITAEIANTYNKDVFAFPNAIDQPFSIGCNNLIKINKASLITSVKDLEYVMNWQPNTANAKRKTIQKLNLADFDKQERSVLEVLYDSSHMLIDELSWRCQLPMGILASVLLSLEFKGVVQSLPGKAYKLVKS